MKPLAEILRAARELIARGWTRNWWATDAKGHRVQWLDRRACRFCAQGAVLRALQDADGHLSREPQIWPLLKVPGASLAAWQDDEARKRTEVLAVFDAAIARLEGKPTP